MTGIKTTGVWKRGLAAICLLLTAGTIAACGSSTDDQNGSSSETAGVPAEAAKALEAAYKGSFGEPPTSSPRPEAGKNIWYLPLDAGIHDENEPGGLAEAANMLGWKLTQFDGQYSSATLVNGMRQAIADHADGVMLYVVNCADVKSGLKDLDQAGIPVVAWEGLDCDETVDSDGNIKSTGQPKLFDAQVTYNNPDDPNKPLGYLELYRDIYAKYQALLMIDGMGGEGKIITPKETDIVAGLVGDKGFRTTIEEFCPKCEMVGDFEFTGNDFGAPLQQKTAQAISQNPDATGLYAGYDAPAISNMAPAIVASGRKDEIYSVAGEGQAAAIDLIREKRGIDALCGYPTRWEGWAGLDAMNRILQGETPPNGLGWPSGIGMQAVDRDHNLPPKGVSFGGEGDSEFPVDFAAAYKRAWGVK